jgi:hypothetical protein
MTRVDFACLCGMMLLICGGYVWVLRSALPVIQP